MASLIVLVITVAFAACTHCTLPTLRNHLKLVIPGVA
jgi:hypothetical protein